MDDRTTELILKRLAILEEQAVRYRRGRFVGANPLTIDLGDSGSPVLAAPPSSKGSAHAFLAGEGNPPYVSGAIAARVFHTVNQSIPNNALTALAFNSERYDTASLHSTVSNTSRLTAPAAGLYAIKAHVIWADGGAIQSYRELFLRINGVIFIAPQSLVTPPVNQGNGISQTVSGDYELAAGDYVEAVARQNNGAALVILAAAANSPEFSMRRAS